MDYQTGFFYLFAAVLLFAGYRVITARNPVHAVLFLMLAFSQAAALWLLLKAEFLGITLVLVYLGAVMVLFLFVVMMLDINLDTVRKGFWRHFPLAAVLGGLVAAELIAVLWAGFPSISAAPEVAAQAANYSNTRELGVLLYTEYLYPIQVAGVILLVAMITAIALTLRQRKDSKAINPNLQVHVRAKDRLVVLPMSATQKAAPAVEAAAAPEGQKP
ncbi:NADH-quinone oxidoreductase subunit J [Hydrogenophaga sp. BPS33]|uniref:NADH-quinone oxidoreductase subunit J n=1 Tax=Hydrogenophaga sp. BPS33 TaxID=2651974 RepID=UPI0013203197|nr:NADH-quinone oxidoreductase subunit J [Hydrogenophaga sp. BPS33]QHE85449.1 NADH-quinone oxidoreductase subunit J [Hydrogenophaga sp. BPS33]